MVSFRMLRAVLAAAVLVAASSLASVPSVASGPTCWVKNVRTQVVTVDLQAAVFAAQPDDILRIRGVCGAFSASQDITLVGPATLSWPECEACGPAGILGEINSGRVTLKDLTLTKGSSTSYGGAIHNFGTLILKGSTAITGSLAEDGGGGIYNEGLLIMKDSSSVSDNNLLYGYGGGIWNVGTLVMTDHSRVSGNSGVFGGGIYNTGTLVMRDWSAVKANTGETGGGVFNTGRLVLKGASRITENTAYGGTGGGIHSSGVVTFTRHWSGTVCGNSPDDWGRCGSCPTARR